MPPPELVAADSIPGVAVVPLAHHADDRGSFVEVFRQSWLPSGAPTMVQGNRSVSRAGVLRGMHFHHRQADYWFVTHGRVFAALADLRVGSPTEGKVAVLRLEDSDQGLYIPRGVAHGYLAEVDTTLSYLVDCYYDGADEFGVAWNDPDLAIPWPMDEPILSDRDRTNPRVADLEAARRVTYSASHPG